MNTIKEMKASQVYYRLRNLLGLSCSIGQPITTDKSRAKPIATVLELDYDPVFLKRFSADEFLSDQVTFLHTSREFHWNQSWHFEDCSPLWNFNLHYFEYLFSMIAAYKHSGHRKYLNKTMDMIHAWIVNNPSDRGGEGWSSYTISLRLTNWLSYYATVHTELDNHFKEEFIASIYEQYRYLSHHLEKHILGNHYLEDLKTLVLCALFFQDKPMLQVSLNALKKECKEEILSDGMHFELSPMYHKLIFEDLIRVAVALRERIETDGEIEKYLQSMLDVAWSLEEGLERIPLFNDSGNNVAKSLSSLVNACKNHFGIHPKFKSCFKDSGFYILKRGDWKLIVDAGQPGPTYIPGHAHCDAMSFELFKAGKPILVNCGTYAYQCKERSFFRSTAAHNTVMINDTEQSQCWGGFRVAKRSSVKVLYKNNDSIGMELIDQKKQKVRRTISFKDDLTICDESAKNKLSAFVHLKNSMPIKMDIQGIAKNVQQKYAPEYGVLQSIHSVKYEGYSSIALKITLEK